MNAKRGDFSMDTDKQQPNVIFIMSDDHAAHAMSCYDSKINETPNLDRIADEGMIFHDCYCTNSICAPSRAAILTGKYNHLNGVRTLGDTFDGRQQTMPKILRKMGMRQRSSANGIWDKEVGMIRL